MSIAIRVSNDTPAACSFEVWQPPNLPQGETFIATSITTWASPRCTTCKMPMKGHSKTSCSRVAKQEIVRQSQSIRVFSQSVPLDLPLQASNDHIEEQTASTWTIKPENVLTLDTLPREDILQLVLLLASNPEVFAKILVVAKSLDQAVTSREPDTSHTFPSEYVQKRKVAMICSVTGCTRYLFKIAIKVVFNVIKAVFHVIFIAFLTIWILSTFPCNLDGAPRDTFNPSSSLL
ncbi:hypothetical protein FA15DRAFT_659216 [Coprinopsis marcescibilis]|uniref:Uncharacterized protein n=1 Tax=Coprinopsis marcescibilis TaxID=230819 RepID=A0A5C3KJ64_COPMA|nr:hypothetical protein FA15DRAFT_659216 [Coprinopsis marcescibilis]